MKKSLLPLAIYFLFFFIPCIGFSQIEIQEPAHHITIECDVNIDFYLASNGYAVVSSACGPLAWSHTSSNINSNCNGYETVVVTFIVTDECGNTETTIGTVTIMDTTPPSIYPGASDMTVTCDGAGNTDELNAWLASNGGAEAFDNCSSVAWSNYFSGLSSNCNKTVSTTVNFLVTDECANTAMTFATFTIEAAIIICPTANIVLSSQADVDAFSTNYPDCSEIMFGLTISGSDITDLSPLSAITGVTGPILIKNNPLLEDLQGLNNIKNPLVDNLIIDNNVLLEDITALNDVIIDSNISITNNASLSICNINPICYFLSQWDSVNNPNAIVIENNAAGCTDINEIESICESLIPVNDECEGAEALTFGVSSIFSNSFSTISGHVPSCNIDSQFRADVWFSFNTGALTMIDVLVDNGYSLQLWKGTCGTLTQVDEACGANELNEISVTANTDYLVQVWYNNSNLGRNSHNKTTTEIAGDFEIVIKESLALSTEQDLYLEFSIYPNPVKEELIIKNTQNSTIENIFVYSALGKKIIETNKTSINFSKISSGIYFVKIKTNIGQLTKKIIKK